MFLNFPFIKKFNLYVATFQQHLHMGYIALSWYNILEFVVPIKISWIDGLVYGVYRHFQQYFSYILVEETEYPEKTTDLC